MFFGALSKFKNRRALASFSALFIFFAFLKPFFLVIRESAEKLTRLEN
jgi:hypothetical protein